MKNVSRILAAAVLTTGLGVVSASAQTTVTLEDQSQTTTLSANVSEQARVSVPATVTFNVTNTSAITDATAAVTVENIALATATKQLQISLAANALAFTGPRAGVTWASSDVSWDAVAFSNAGVGTAGALAGIGTYGIVQTCAVDVPACSHVALPFHLAAKPAVTAAGSHTLVMTWKFASIGT